MTADKRIPVTEPTWENLHDLKEAGQTYDELLQDMIDAYQGDRWLAEKARDVREADSEDLTPLEDL